MEFTDLARFLLAGTEFDIWTKVVRFECLMHHICSTVIRKYMNNFVCCFASQGTNIVYISFFSLGSVYLQGYCQRVFQEQAEMEMSHAYPPSLSSFGMALSLFSPLITPFSEPDDQEPSKIQIPTANSPTPGDEGEDSPRQRRNSLASVSSQRTETSFSYEKIVYPLYEDFYAVCSELLTRNGRMYHPMWSADISRDCDADTLRVTRASHAFAFVCCWYGLYQV